jgi:hypothetical protein
MINDPRPGPFPHVYVLKCCRQSLHYKIIIFHCTMRCSMTFHLSGLYECFLLICKQPNRTDEEWYIVCVEVERESMVDANLHLFERDRNLKTCELLSV